MNRKTTHLRITRRIDKLLSRHKQAWAELWKTGDIQIEGDLDAATCAIALYNLYSYPSRNQTEHCSYGLVVSRIQWTYFWDSELWMYPTLLALQPDMAKSCLDYRSDRLQKAKQKATVYGYKELCIHGI
jgi:trehalose/maltose hydrolase-like predicted phosphorylase